MKDELKYIYKAKSCTDVKDCEGNMKMLKSMIDRYGWKPSLRARYFAIDKRKAQLEKRASA